MSDDGAEGVPESAIARSDGSGGCEWYDDATAVELGASSRRRTMAPQASVDAVFYGRVGGLETRQRGAVFRARDGGAPSVPLLTLCAAHFQQHVVAPALKAGLEIVAYGHSWNPEIASVLDALYSARSRSRHEAPLTRESLREQCGRFKHTNSSRYGRNDQLDCERTRSQVLGLQRALRLRAALGRADLVFVSRWDVLWERPMPLADAPAMLGPRGAAPRFWLPRHCAARAVAPSALAAELAARREQVCGPGGAGPALTSAAADDCASKRFCLERRERVNSIDNRTRYARVARQFFVLDQWLVTDSAGADAFATVADAPLFERGLEAIAAFAPHRVWICGHFLFGWHLLQVLNATLRFRLDDGIDFAIGRIYARAGDECEGVAEDAGESPPPATQLAASHQGVALVQPGGLLGSCGRGSDFRCPKASRRCRAAAAAAPPGATVAVRERFLRCAAGWCNASAARCAPGAAATDDAAGVLLGLWRSMASGVVRGPAECSF